MQSHTVDSYDRELNKVIDSILEMGELVKEMVSIADKSLFSSDDSYIEIARETDKKINIIEAEVEFKAVDLIALRQPMAIDLRELVAALKIAVIMERMGDLAKNSTRRLDNTELAVNQKHLDSVHKMNKILLEMLNDAMQSYKKHDDEKAAQVFTRDEEVDKIYINLVSSLEKEIKKDPTQVHSIMQLIYALKNFERIGDYITKIVMISHYIITGHRRFASS
jgi:phosphate transport system protein